MPAKLPNAIKSLVIRQWLQGKPRNDIAAENGLSSGAVTNIVGEWRRNLGLGLADELRELAATIKKVGIDAAQCALGFRIATFMLNVGVKEDRFESFILDVYNRCKDIGLLPENISFYLQDLLEFSSTVLPLSKIPDYVKEKRDETRKLEQEIEKLTVQIEALRLEKSDAESFRDMALQEGKMTTSGLKWYFDLKAELRKYGIRTDDIPYFAKIVASIREHGYDVGKVLNEFSDLEALRLNHDFLQYSSQSLENKINQLEQQRSTLEVFVNMHKQCMSKYQDLETMGFGLKQLDFLWTTLNEIALENDLHVQEAVEKFLSDIEQQYDNKLGFESKIESLRDEVNKLSQERTRLRTELLLLPLVGPKLVKLTQIGVSDQDIVNIATVFEKYIAGIDRQSFVSEIDKYGGIKSAVQKLSKESDRLKQEVGSLQTQQRDLNIENQKILAILIHSRHTFDFLHGAGNSLRNEILGLVSIVAYTTYLMKSQFQHIENLKRNHTLSGGDEFASLTRAHQGDKTVSMQEIKRQVIKAIEVMQGKLDVNDELSKLLSKATLALMVKENN